MLKLSCHSLFFTLLKDERTKLILREEEKKEEPNLKLVMYIYFV